MAGRADAVAEWRALDATMPSRTRQRGRRSSPRSPSPSPPPECRRCTVSVERIDFDEWLRRNRADEPIERRDSSENNRLGKNQNGMVMLPRSLYRQHPVGDVAAARRRAPKRRASPADDDTSFQLVLYESERAEPRRERADEFTLKHLSERVDDGLPSAMWEVERVPPIVERPRDVDAPIDPIAAELEALMADAETNGAERQPPAEPEPDARAEPDERAPDGYVLKHVIFRRLATDKQTYDRLVTFNRDMEYSVAIDDKLVELLGAPEAVFSVDDLKILLQIVDELDLDSFNVTVKS